jgi:hypothetical protein
LRSDRDDLTESWLVETDMEAWSLMLEAVVRLVGGWALRVCGSSRSPRESSSVAVLRRAFARTQTLTIEAGLNGLRSRQDVGRRIAALVARLIPPDDPALARHRLVRPGRRVAGRSFLSA